MKHQREAMGLDQEEFAELLREASGDDRWKQQKVSNLERRVTKFTDPDLKLVAETQGMPYHYYFDGPEVAYARLREAGLAQSNVIPLRKRRVARPIEMGRIPA